MRYAKLSTIRKKEHDLLEQIAREYENEPTVSLRTLSDRHGINYVTLFRKLRAMGVEFRSTRRKADASRNL